MAAAGKASREIRMNTDTGFLKLIAIITMLVDHMGKMVFPQYPILRIIGRLAFPLFAYCMAVGCVYTKSPLKYALRVAILAVVSQPLYAVALGHQAMGTFDWAHNFFRPDMIISHYWYKPNILFSLLLGILLIASIREKKFVITALLALACWLVQGYLDYGIRGILLMLLFYAFLDKPVASFTWVGLFMWYWGMPGFFTSLSTTQVNTQFYALFALPLIYIRMNTGIKLNKYVFYAFYPAHLLLIYLIRLSM